MPSSYWDIAMTGWKSPSLPFPPGPLASEELYQDLCRGSRRRLHGMLGSGPGAEPKRSQRIIGEVHGIAGDQTMRKTWELYEKDVGYIWLHGDINHPNTILRMMWDEGETIHIHSYWGNQHESTMVDATNPPADAILAGGQWFISHITLWLISEFWDVTGDMLRLYPPKRIVRGVVMG